MRRRFSCILLGVFLAFIAAPAFSDPFPGAGTILHDVRPGNVLKSLMAAQ